MQAQTHPLFLFQHQRNTATTAVAATTSLPSVLASIVLEYTSLGDELIYSTESAIGAKLADGSVVTWGQASYGGDSSSVHAELKAVDTMRNIS